MKRWVVSLLAVVCLAGGAGLASAQTTGEIYGRVTDASGAVLPGATVTLTSPVLLQPLTAVTSDGGTYRFPNIPIGTYAVKFELAGFRTTELKGIRVEIGLNAQINQALEISTVEETLVVTAESPLVDLKDAGKNTRFTQEQLQAIPSARDPWVIMEQAAGVAMDRQNVGGSASGQQSNFVARGANWNQAKWNLDGVDITDMSATGGSPVYYDFDAFEEMQISTGGADVSMQSPGVGINLVTKSGTDRIRGAGRYYVTDDSFQSVNVDDELRKQGATTGNPIQNIKDYGVEAGGPIVKGRAWIWGSYGKQKINVGINNFYKNTPECQAMKSALAKDPLAVSVEDTRTCLNTDETLLNNYNLKYSMQVAKGNQFSWYFNGAEKVRNARDASDLRPLETTYRQLGVTREDLGSSWWKTGMPKSYKWSDRHVFTDRFMVEGSYAHVGNNFALTFHEEELRSVQPSYEISSPAGLWGRSYQEAVYVRPTDSIDIVGNYFLPNVWGGDHALKFGFKFRNDIAHSESMYGGDAYARFSRGVPSEAQIYRRGFTEYGLHNRNVYAQDTFTRGRFTVNVGARFDYQTDFANAAEVAANQWYGMATFAGVYNGVTYSGAPFNQLPATSFPGAEAGVSFKDWSPRAGINYDIAGDGRSVIKFNYARYVGQVGTGDMSSTYNTLVATQVRYPWVDLNADKFIQPNEIVLTSAPLSWTSGYNYLNPTQTTTTGKNDPDLTSDKTDELIFSFDKQVGRSFAFGASYIWRKYTNFRWSDTVNWDSSNYREVKWTPPAADCPANARCQEITYFEPTSQTPTDYVYTNRPDYWRGFNGFELTARKRFSQRWQLNGSYSWNDAKVHYDSPKAYEDPSNIAQLDDAQYAPESTTSGLSNLFVNAKWIFRVSGSYILPFWDINVAGVYNSRSGYPFIANIQTPNRPFSAGRTNIYLDKLGDNRYSAFQQVDLRIDKPFTFFDRLKIIASMDVFNLFNQNTELSVRPVQNASNANTISALLAPRVIRFGFRATW